LQTDKASWLSIFLYIICVMKCFLALVFCFAAVLASRRQSSPELVRQYENKVISKSLSDSGSSSYRSSNIKDKQASFHEVLLQRGGFNSKEEPPKLSTSSPNNMPGNILSNIALVCGTTVGAGILALPRYMLFIVNLVFIFCIVVCYRYVLPLWYIYITNFHNIAFITNFLSVYINQYFPNIY
jgi:hypothetical protein